MYYTKKYAAKEELMAAIHDYMNYYTNKREQRKLETLTPTEYHKKNDVGSVKKCRPVTGGKSHKIFRYLKCLLDRVAHQR
ncbi:MAG: IS3 family transposase [Enterocloster bolteae]